MVFLVAGPPCAGKTTYVRAQAAPEDRVLDYDDFLEGLAGERYAQDSALAETAARRFHEAVDELELDPPTGDVWIVQTAALRWQRQGYRRRFGAAVLVLLPDAATCLARAARERPPIWQEWIARWFAQYQPDPADVVM